MVASSMRKAAIASRPTRLRERPAGTVKACNPVSTNVLARQSEFSPQFYAQIATRLRPDTLIGQLEETVDKNREEGAKRQAKGSIKEAAGKLTGNNTQEVSGKIEKNVGKIQREVGKAADRSRKQH